MNETTFIQRWFADICSRKPLEIPRRITVVGVRDQHRGPRWEFAKVEISIEPSKAFALSCAAKATPQFVDATIFGLLDIFLTELAGPVKNFQLTIHKLEEHPVDSSVIAFRAAGRDAARKILDELLRTAYDVRSL